MSLAIAKTNRSHELIHGVLDGVKWNWKVTGQRDHTRLNPDCAVF